MKRALLTLGITVAILGLLFYGCCCFIFGAFHQPYKFRQDYDQIAKIEIVKKRIDRIDMVGYDPATLVILKTLDTSEHRTFIDELVKVEGSRVGMDPSEGFGRHIIRITYRDGEVELIGHYNNGYISVDGKLHQDCYSMDKDQFLGFLSKVLEMEITE